MKTVALIPAAGYGTRLGRGPKGLLEIGGKKLLVHLLEKVVPLVNNVLIGVPGEFREDFKHLERHNVAIMVGGQTRQETVEILLKHTAGEIVLIQDAARPFTKPASIAAVIEAAGMHGAAGLFLDPTVPVAIIEGGFAVKSYSRNNTGVFQAPQAFRREILSKAIQKTQGLHFQSTAEMVLAAGYKIKCIEGDPYNIKITDQFDLSVAEKVIMQSVGIQ
ncbi:MAG: 2-C-methyl-D-erythritol 4-phosphate cytidylyltransferase [Syntrophotaleaceae bacterium]